MGDIVEQTKAKLHAVEGEALKSISEAMGQPTSTVNKDEQTLLESLGLDTPVPRIEKTTTLFPALSNLPGVSLDADTINQKLTKIQSSIDDGFAQIITKISALNLSKQAGGRKTRRRARKSRQKKRV